MVVVRAWINLHHVLVSIGETGRNTFSLGVGKYVQVDDWDQPYRHDDGGAGVIVEPDRQGHNVVHPPALMLEVQPQTTC